VPDRVQIDTTQKRQKTTENQNAMGRQPSLSRTDVYDANTFMHQKGGIATPRLQQKLHISAAKRPQRNLTRWEISSYNMYDLCWKKGPDHAKGKTNGRFSPAGFDKEKLRVSAEDDQGHQPLYERNRLHDGNGFFEKIRTFCWGHH